MKYYYVGNILKSDIFYKKYNENVNLVKVIADNIESYVVINNYELYLIKELINKQNQASKEQLQAIKNYIDMILFKKRQLPS